MTEKAETSIRIHVSTPGPRSGEPFSISVETINAGDLTEDEMQREVDAAMRVYELTRTTMVLKVSGATLDPSETAKSVLEAKVKA